MSDIGLPDNLSRDDAYIQGISDGEDALFKDLRSSYKLAMESQKICPRCIETVLITVDDYFDNHYG